MKKLLRWIFEKRMQALEEETADNNFKLYIKDDWTGKKLLFAETKLREMGYEICYESGVREYPSEVMHYSQIGFSLKKIDL